MDPIEDTGSTPGTALVVGYDGTPGSVAALTTAATSPAGSAPCCTSCTPTTRRTWPPGPALAPGRRWARAPLSGRPP